MKISASKKTIVVFVISIALLVFVGIAILFLPKKEEPGLQKLVEYCSAEEKGNCPLLLYKEEIEDTQRCFSARIPKVTAENTNESFTFCIEGNLIDWKNPYSNYESFVPVNVYIEKKIEILPSVKKVSFNLIEDKDIEKLFPNIRFTQNEKITGIMTKEQAEIERNGYYLSNMKFDEEQKPYITILNTWLESYAIEEDGTLTFILDIVIGGEMRKTTVNTKTLLFSEDLMADDIMTVDASNIEKYSPKMKDCISYFSVNHKKNPLTEKNIDAYYTELLNKEEIDKDILFILLYCPY